VRWPGLAGLAYAGRGQSAGFATPTGRAYGNQLPGITGRLDAPFRPGPGPSRRGGYSPDGQLGGIGDGYVGADPADPPFHAWPRRVVLGEMQETYRREGTLGHNDKLTVKDRHGYWDTGNQRTGVTFNPANAHPNTYNDPLRRPPRPDFRLINRTVSYQKGSDASRNQDDLTRKYTWLGEQGSGWAPVYGGTPGLYQPYGSRGGVPYPIVSPVDQGQPGDGPHLVWSGPPHGLHSDTPWKGGAQIISRFMATPQTRPVRQDRPSNSPQAGQSYSQTVLPQGGSRVGPATGRRTGGARHTGRQWGGRGGPNGVGNRGLAGGHPQAGALRRAGRGGRPAGLAGLVAVAVQ
jgi:hypothetical protein